MMLGGQNKTIGARVQSLPYCEFSFGAEVATRDIKAGEVVVEERPLGMPSLC